MDLSVTKSPIISPKIGEGWGLAITTLSCVPGGGSNAINYQRMRWLALADMVRRRWDSKFRPVKLKLNNKVQVEACGEFLNKLVDLISEVNLVCGGQHPTLTFALLLAEHEVWGIAWSDGAESKTEFLKLYRQQNRQLHTLEENPFTLQETRQFFDTAMFYAESRDRFRVTKWTPFVKSRMALATAMKADYSLHIARSDVTLIARQGRKKEK